MKYLLDVNVLIALGFRRHEFHQRVVRWVGSFHPNDDSVLLTCAITELGFIRVLVQSPLYNLDLTEATSQLRSLKTSRRLKFEFLPDDQDVIHLPSWVKSGSQTTDGHLIQLANAHDAAFVTLDKRIPAALLVP